MKRLPKNENKNPIINFILAKCVNKPRELTSNPTPNPKPIIVLSKSI
jgi:hypothetical protein